MGLLACSKSRTTGKCFHGNLRSLLAQHSSSVTCTFMQRTMIALLRNAWLVYDTVQSKKRRRAGLARARRSSFPPPEGAAAGAGLPRDSPWVARTVTPVSGPPGLPGAPRVGALAPCLAPLLPLSPLLPPAAGLPACGRAAPQVAIPALARLSTASTR